MRLRCELSDAPGMHTGALLCLTPPPTSLAVPSCSNNCDLFQWHAATNFAARCTSEKDNIAPQLCGL